jgi:hypothetical protein
MLVYFLIYQIEVDSSRHLFVEGQMDVFKVACFICLEIWDNFTLLVVDEVNQNCNF